MKFLQRLQHPENRLLFILAAVQFTNIMDFMIMMPLGPQLMRMFNISPAQFSILVSSYTIAAGITGLLAAFYIDRFGRRTALLWLYMGFTLGTFLCGFAPSYELLVMARILTGLFGGILGALVFSIVGDAIPFERRGYAMGIVMTSFSIASVLGVPFGLFLANRLSWHAPFYFLGLMGAIVTYQIVKHVPMMSSHLESRDQSESIFALFKEISKTPTQLFALSLTPFLMLGHFTIVPFLSPYMVSNVGFTDDQLTYIYILGGLATIITSPRIGKLSDRLGARRVFRFGIILALIPVWLVTHLTRVPVGVALLVTTLFFIAGNARFIPSIALISSTVEAKRRGGFMSINSSLQQFSAGIAAAIAGVVVTRGQDGKLLHYGSTAYITIAAALLCLFIVNKVEIQGRQL